MAVELSYLVASAALYSVMIVAEAIVGNLQYTPKQLMGSRDDLPPPDARLARAKRATLNMGESMILFVPVVLAVVVADRTNDMTALGAAVFFWGRVAYAPLYWFGVSGLRTLAWFISIVGIAMIFLQVIPFTGAS